MRRIIRAAAVALCAWTAAAASPERGDAASLTCAVVDAETGEPLACRCRVVDLYGSNRYPPILSSFYHPANGGYFYAEGTFTVSVPAGRTIVRTGLGFEYLERTDTLVVAGDTSIVVPLERVIDLADLGWIAGDSHVHINHAGGYFILDPPDVLLMARAEGLGVVNCLDNDYYFTGAPDPCSVPGCVVFMSEEARSSSYGHLGLLGMSSLAHPVSSAWWPLCMDVADSCHARDGAIVVAAHPVTTEDFEQVEAWPGNGLARELPADLAAGRIDAFDVMSYSNLVSGGAELDLWYRLLNCGFRLSASAGTDAAMNRLDSPPLGGYRVYVRPSPGDTGFFGWLRGLAAGRSVVTNGPLVTHFSLDGHEPGDSVGLAFPGKTVHGVLSIRGCYPVDAVEIVVNGEVAVVLDPPSPRASLDTVFTLTILESSWVAARATGPKTGWLPVGARMLAHTSPVYFALRGARVVDPDAADGFAQQLADLEALALEKGSWPNGAAEERVFAELAAAREYFEGLAGGAATGTGGGGAPMALSAANAPNPFEGETTIDFRAGPGGLGSVWPEAVSVYDASGRLVRRLPVSRGGAGAWRAVWDGCGAGGARAPSGVYFARLEWAGGSAVRKMVLIR